MSRLFDNWNCDSSLPDFSPLRRDSEMRYWAIHCPCGSNSFRVAGWPSISSGAGTLFWRTLARIWREARQTTRDGEPVDSPFALSLLLQCDECDRKEELFAGVDWEALEMPNDPTRPREGYRCRACRRAPVEVVVGVARRGAASPVDAERGSEASFEASEGPAGLPDHLQSAAGIDMTIVEYEQQGLVTLAHGGIIRANDPGRVGDGNVGAAVYQALHVVLGIDF